MQNVKAVLFDLDGTLVDSLPEIYQGVSKAVSSMGYKVPSEAAVGAMIGRGMGVLVDRLCNHLGIDVTSETRQTLFSRLLDAWEEAGGRYVTFYPGVVDAIVALRAQGVKTALVTNKLRSLTVEFIESRGIAHLFDAVVAGDDCPKNKPAPDMLLRAMDILKVDASQAIMVGDSRNDALAGRAAGVTVALVETGYNEGVSIADWAREAGFSKIYPSARMVCEKMITTGQL